MSSYNTDGYCKHFERSTCSCTIREHRPIPCRAYDCRNDQRIWVDFEKKIVNAEIDKLFERDSSGESRKPDKSVIKELEKSPNGNSQMGINEEVGHDDSQRSNVAL
ncbi:MAG: YkgJ family cysteine cluster protein [bacterium]